MPPAAAPHDEPAPPRQAEPRAVPGRVLGQLAAQHDDGAQVLHGDGEAELADEAGAALGRFQRYPPQQGQPGGGQAEGAEHAEDVDGVHPQGPQREAADGGGGGGDVAGDVGRRPGEDGGAHERGQPRPDAQARGHHGGADEADGDGGPGHAPAGGPGETTLAQPAPGEDPADGADHGAQEGGESDLSQGGTDQGDAPVDR
jgi:hypothetical protein